MRNLVPRVPSKRRRGEDLTPANSRSGVHKLPSHKARGHFETTKISNIFGDGSPALCQGLLRAAVLNAKKTLGTRLVYAVLRNTHKIFLITPDPKNGARTSCCIYSIFRLISFIKYMRQSLPPDPRPLRLTYFVWFRSKLPHEVVSIMLRINVFRSWFAQFTVWCEHVS